MSSPSAATEPVARSAVKKTTWWTGVAVALVIAGGLSLAAYADELPAFVTTTPHVDKVLHVLVGGLLAFFLDGALGRRALGRSFARVPAATVAILVPAGVDEYLQRYSATRSSSLGDFAADVVGVVVFTWLSRRAAA